jgi:hypothetical protein
MAFRVPVFNILANLWTFHAAPYPPPGAPRIANQQCQLYHCKEQPLVSGAGLELAMLIRLPAGTDIRGPLSTTNFDVVEVPVGSGNWYLAEDVNDIARGFQNEYRVASLEPVQVNTPRT